MKRLIYAPALWLALIGATPSFSLSVTAHVITPEAAHEAIRQSDIALHRVLHTTPVAPVSPAVPAPKVAPQLLAPIPVPAEKLPAEIHPAPQPAAQPDRSSEPTRSLPIVAPPQPQAAPPPAAAPQPPPRPAMPPHPSMMGPGQMPAEPLEDRRSVPGANPGTGPGSRGPPDGARGPGPDHRSPSDEPPGADPRGRGPGRGPGPP